MHAGHFAACRFLYNELKPRFKAPKLHFLDSGLLAVLRNLSPVRIHTDRTHFWSILEFFVLGELLKLAI